MHEDLGASRGCAHMAAEKWVFMVTAQTPTNIAVIKYWGKRDEVRILPVNDSISVTLDPDHLCTVTTVAVSPAFDRDRMWLNGKVLACFISQYDLSCFFIEFNGHKACILIFSFELDLD